MCLKVNDREIINIPHIWQHVSINRPHKIHQYECISQLMHIVQKVGHLPK